MTPTPQCPREQDVVAAIRTGRLSGDHDSGLRAHVEACAVCQDVAAMASQLRALEIEAGHAGTLPSAGQIWWRARVRARADAARRAARPVLVAQAAAAACAIGLLAAVLSSLLPSATFTAGLLLAPIAWIDRGLVLYAAAGAWLILVPVALYFALARE